MQPSARMNGVNSPSGTLIAPKTSGSFEVLERR